MSGCLECGNAGCGPDCPSRKRALLTKKSEWDWKAIFKLSINEWVQKCHNDSLEAGWWSDENLTNRNIHAVKIALIHSEISEALEGIRKNIYDAHLPHRKAVEVELADALIRIFDLAGALKLDLEGAVIEKCEYNKHRADHKESNRQAEGGKKF